jgi:8-oxo-dGTP pyrophosphatase MutT (NUDIX family)
MLHEKSAGTIVYRLDSQEGLQYLLLYLRGDYWNFSKGHVEDGESEAEAAIRELEEETGIKGAKVIDGWRQQTQFFYKESRGEKAGEFIRKDLALYLAELPAGQQVKLLVNEGQGERVNGYAWLPFKTAVKYIKFKNLKEILEEADSFVKTLKH